jgi:hypothetical protein
VNSSSRRKEVQAWPGSADGSTVLGAVAQEDDGWLELTAGEYDAIAGRLPVGIRLISDIR